ncbi:MAG: ABC transporter ATP-binding protein [bacterium]
MPDTHVIETHQLTKRFGDFHAVEALDLNVRSNQITGFLGRNGAGKSTTIKMLLGMTHPTSGTGALLGRSIDDPRANREARRHVAYVAEDKQLYGYLTVEELIRFTRSFYADWRPDVAARLLATYQLPPQRKVRALSKGMRTKLALLLALSRQPELLILDEPSEGLDPVGIEELLQTLVGAASEGTTIFFSSHQLPEVERIADRVCIVDHGVLVEDFALDALREDYRRITFGFAAAAPDDELLIPGIRRVRRAGRQLSLVVSGNAEAVAARGRSMNAVTVDVAPISLREVFLESVQDDA